MRIDGHATSVRLEASFWQILEEIAQAQEMPLPRFIGLIYHEALQYTGDITNFASLLRCACLIYLRNPTDVMTHVRRQLFKANLRQPKKSALQAEKSACRTHLLPHHKSESLIYPPNYWRIHDQTHPHYVARS